MGEYDLIAVGASWGGLTALERLLALLPEGFGTPIVVAQHRAADSVHGAISHLLARHGGVDACEAGDKDQIEPGRVYVAPPDYHLLVEHGSFALSVDAAVRHSRPSVDVLLESAADAYGPRLVAAVLTGTGSDGADGIAHAKRRGALTIAQDPETAERADMPRAAIATGAVDRVATLEGIAGVLVDACAGEPHAGRAA